MKANAILDCLTKLVLRLALEKSDYLSFQKLYMEFLMEILDFNRNRDSILYVLRFMSGKSTDARSEIHK